MQCRFFPVYFKLVSGLVFFHIPVHIHDAVGFFENRLYLFGDFPLTFVIRTVNFGDQGGEYRWPRWDFGHLNPGPISIGDFF